MVSAVAAASAAAPLRGVLYGLGSMGAHHQRHLMARDDVRLEVSDPPRGLRVGPAPPDFAVVAVPTPLHLQVALPLLEAGVPCLVEKPLASDPEQARQLAAHAHCLPGHVERFNPVFDVLGGARPSYLQAERLAPAGGRARSADIVLDLMIHDLDLALWLLGDDIEDLRAVGLAVPAQGAGSQEGPDIANARLETVDGKVANLSASRVSRSGLRKLRLVTSQDYWSLDLQEHQAERIRWRAGRLDAMPVAVPARDALRAEHDAMIDHVRGRRAYPVPASHGQRAVELAWRVKRAARHQLERLATAT